MNLDSASGIDLTPEQHQTVDDVAELLRHLKRRHARRRGDSELTVREMSRKTGYAVGAIGAYLSGRTLPPTDRFDVLIQLLGADEMEQRALATIRDRIADRARRSARPVLEPTARPGPGPGPVDLPPATGVFVGRDAELARIVAHLTRITAETRIAVVHGAPGCGRTQLVVQAASRLLEHYPHGCLFMDLRDITPAQDAHEATGRLLYRLGVAPDVVPDEPGERTAMYRRVIRKRRLLLVLDNADNVQAITPLIPPGGDAGILVTARGPVGALDEALDVRLTGLQPQDARELFIDIAAGVAAPDALLDRATAACQYLPLAIRVAAARVRGRSRLAVDELVSGLEDGTRSLTVLDDGGRSVARSFEAACAALPSDFAATFALLCVHPGRRIDAWTVSALTGAAEADVARALAGLADAALLEPDGADGYMLHDLARAASAARAAKTLSAGATLVAGRRILEAYVAAVQYADLLVAPARYRPEPVRPATGAPMPPFTTSAQALAWLDRHQDTLVLVVEQAAAGSRPEACWKLAYALRDQFFRTRATRSWLHTHRLALAAAEECGDRWAVAVIANSLGLAHALSGRIAAADELYRRALADFRDLGDVHGEANANRHLAWTAYLRGDHADAIAQADAAVRIYRNVGAARNAAITLRTLALAEAASGRTEAAPRHLHEALRVFAAEGLAADEAMALNGLGEIIADESPIEALGHHLRAWRRARAGAARSEEARALRGIARAAIAIGRDGTAGRLRAQADRLDYQPPGLRAGVYLANQ
ncbi:tetratricopeptide repeat protein [Micromonospora tulbaghiae]|uniref:tetratricopeptide repeat protein n=1 Tax=Micromonospora tulbaghiae TaxID=479978 RepID=UPI00341A2954